MFNIKVDDVFYTGNDSTKHKPIVYKTKIGAQRTCNKLNKYKKENNFIGNDARVVVAK
jgi:hypothetical protein